MKWFELVGTTFFIHQVKHTCLAVTDDAVVMLQYDNDGAPCQYVVAHEPYRANGELCWLNGDYFPFFHYATTADALAEVVASLQDDDDGRRTKE